MKVKVFQIRLYEQFLASDQAEINDFISKYDVVNTNSKVIEDGMNYWSVLIFYQDRPTKSKSDKQTLNSEEELSPEEMIIYKKLKEWRVEKANEAGSPAYTVFHNTHLMAIAKHKPSNLEDLENINGLGSSKIARYGSEILEVLENA
ncbi:HRDC domain-containing protein [Chryseobacterium sp. SC28]|uniref:HRDC domain-containing protein n=1 Tax=Chryseobacterium sp. SC28 TaxID=2268028 RepID=UPI000F655170|nr:HRDC domain-containing protein [Chryseobacterium sp. SC28]RRQ46401.1 hypothetical protein DTW91_05640 [Chryseobacterium sp. SC28]